ncbi:MAG: L-histidine N(alpha)-methyltransferase [Alteromonadaceae bacterium]|jgi:dimethylhistidine N-methyltransferase|uniref:Dimethylhistidine N-methyltransferase n=2 Tax=Paraglaciecola chathamensis TaxID=368405 RepID=A0A8H9IA59_9ALTE|nr:MULTISPECIES: L-histidine N(alpha)-methyltransferase [Paraglaciecola]MBN25087.1 L-histidine N(alpha)-methyltransferase [Alteromonadaceae bacterium]GGZ63955.1 dimethylhistidine N-methyltransferase [Paraglaciecola oceanifecundans]|tara:strand:+ start:27261 stop:28247 length:987 start_codon:yes stop_codon:yes gene_type:complete
MSVPPVAQRADSTNQLSPELQLIAEITAGLNAQQKIISSKFFYDSVGSDLFDQICDLPEYYPYLTEMNMLPHIAGDLSQSIAQPVELVEFGAGSLTKIRILLESIKMIESVVPIDIAHSHLQRAADKLSADYPHVNVAPIFADFTQPVSLQNKGKNQDQLPKLGFFPGSTIGNFNRDFALTFLQRLRKTLGDSGMLLIGVDTKKSLHTLHQAYNDSAGVTAKFNLNILRHVNHIAASNFDLDAFEHYAFYNPHFGRIEMHLVSKIEQSVHINGQSITFAQGETIHTENSYKYRPDEFVHLARMAGWRLEQQWLANDDMFSVFLLHADR